MSDEDLRNDVAKLSSEELLPLVYEELRRIAANHMARELPGQTLSATALVHEAYFRLTQGTSEEKWENKSHFFGAAAVAMRRILIDIARRKKAVRHGGNHKQANLETSALIQPENDDLDFLEFEEALKAYEEEFPKKAKLVELRCFVGLSNREAADVLGVSTKTAERYWNFSLAWLRNRIARWST